MALKQGNSDSHMAGSQLLLLLYKDETMSRQHLILKFLVAEIVVCGPSVPSRCDCNFHTGAAVPLVPPKFKLCCNLLLSLPRLTAWKR